MTTSIPQLKDFLRKNIGRVLDVDIDDLKKRGYCHPQFIKVKSGEKDVVDFMKDLLEFIGLEFYIIEPYDVVGLRNSGKAGRPKGSMNFPKKPENIVKSSPVIIDNPVGISEYTKEIISCEECGFNGTFKVVSESIIMCPVCYNKIDA